jgi:hypothetical protein
VCVCVCRHTPTAVCVEEGPNLHTQHGTPKAHSQARTRLPKKLKKIVTAGLRSSCWHHLCTFQHKRIPPPPPKKNGNSGTQTRTNTSSVCVCVCVCKCKQGVTQARTPLAYSEVQHSSGYSIHLSYTDADTHKCVCVCVCVCVCKCKQRVEAQMHSSHNSDRAPPPPPPPSSHLSGLTLSPGTKINAETLQKGSKAVMLASNQVMLHDGECSAVTAFKKQNKQ